MGALICVLILLNVSVLHEVSCLKDCSLARSVYVLAVNNKTFFFLVASLVGLHATYYVPAQLSCVFWQPLSGLAICVCLTSALPNRTLIWT